MSENPSPARPVAEPPYLRSPIPDKQFAAALADVPWLPYDTYLVLQADCPVCKAKDAIQAVVTTVGTLPFLTAYASGTAPTEEFVECACDENHEGPSGQKGCGRWAMITPRLAKVSPAPAEAVIEKPAQETAVDETAVDETAVNKDKEADGDAESS
jgi:hypothetical protein